MNTTYFTETTSVTDQKTREMTPKTSPGVVATMLWSTEKTVCKAYSGDVPMSPKTTPRAPRASPAMLPCDRFESCSTTSHPRSRPPAMRGHGRNRSVKIASRSAARGRRGRPTTRDLDPERNGAVPPRTGRTLEPSGATEGGAGSMTACGCTEAHERERIVLTGGPGAGKTAVLEMV